MQLHKRSRFFVLSFLLVAVPAASTLGVRADEITLNPGSFARTQADATDFSVSLIATGENFSINYFNLAPVPPTG